MRKKRGEMGHATTVMSRNGCPKCLIDYCWHRLKCRSKVYLANDYMGTKCDVYWRGLGSIQIGIGIELELSQNGRNWNWNWNFSRDQNWNWNWNFDWVELANSVFNTTNSYLLSHSVTSFRYTEPNLKTTEDGLKLFGQIDPAAEPKS